MADTNNITENNTETNDSTIPVTTRFTLVAENIFTVDEGESIAMAGNLHGKINKGDKFFIVHPKFPAGILAEADTLVVGEETPDTAENCRVAVKIKTNTGADFFPKYTVLSNIAPQVRVTPNVPLENPYLIAMTMEYERLVKDNEFTYSFMAALLTSRYITPVDMELTEPDEAGKTQIKDSKVKFKLLRHPNNSDLLCMPVFTDTAALKLWKGILEPTPEGERAKTMLLAFEQCADIGKKNGGLVLNPFGPTAVYISNANLENTLQLGKIAVEKQREIEANKNN